MLSATNPPPTAAPTTFAAAWDLAKIQCLDGLSDEDKQLFEFSTADDARVAIKDAQALYDKDHKHGRVWGCVNALVGGLETYGRAVDTFVSTTPLFLAPVWGTVRVIMKVCDFCGTATGCQAYSRLPSQAISNFDEYIQKTLEVFGDIGDNLSRFQLYGRIFPTEAGVQKALVKVYVETLQFCISARHVFMLRGGKKGNCESDLTLIQRWQLMRFLK